MGSANSVPERGINDLKDLLSNIGNEEDILGFIPKNAEIKKEMESINSLMAEEMKESTDLAVGASRKSYKEDE